MLDISMLSPSACHPPAPAASCWASWPPAPCLTLPGRRARPRQTLLASTSDASSTRNAVGQPQSGVSARMRADHRNSAASRSIAANAHAPRMVIARPRAGEISVVTGPASAAPAAAATPAPTLPQPASTTAARPAPAIHSARAARTVTFRSESAAIQKEPRAPVTQPVAPGSVTSWSVAAPAVPARGITAIRTTPAAVGSHARTAAAAAAWTGRSSAPPVPSAASVSATEARASPTVGGAARTTPIAGPATPAASAPTPA